MEAIILGAFCLLLFGLALWLILSGERIHTDESARWEREATERRARALMPDKHDGGGRDQ